MNRLAVQPNPCASCPYRLDCPSGVWDAEEYAKLPGYDDDTASAPFLCHKSNATGAPTVCKGWAVVHRHSAAMKIWTRPGVIPPEASAPTKVPLHDSGADAAKAGMKNIHRPGPAARRMIARLAREGSGK